jgi:uncharacterized protein with LGFP repeats
LSGKDGAWESYGEIRSRWAELDYERGVLGYPIDEVYCYNNAARNGARYCVQRYENGYVLSGKDGAWESYGEIRSRWAELDYERGVLGYPIDEVVRENSKMSQKFEGGTVTIINGKVLTEINH